jgi:hypothetical protein
MAACRCGGRPRRVRALDCCSCCQQPDPGASRPPLRRRRRRSPAVECWVPCSASPPSARFASCSAATAARTPMQVSPHGRVLPRCQWSIPATDIERRRRLCLERRRSADARHRLCWWVARQASVRMIKVSDACFRVAGIKELEGRHSAPLHESSRRRSHGPTGPEYGSRSKRLRSWGGVQVITAVMQSAGRACVDGPSGTMRSG